MRIYKELINSIIVGMAIYVVFLIIYFFQGGVESIQSRVDFEDIAIHMLFSISLYMVNYLVFRYTFKKFAARLFTVKHLSTAIIMGIAASVLAIFVLNVFIYAYYSGASLTESIARQKVDDVWISLVISVVVLAIFYAVYYYRHLKERQVKEQKIIAGAASAQFDALKNQLDPHFLFNSLNVLTSLIEENPDQAQRFTTSLSKVYRYVLEQKNKELVPVEEELAFAKTYMSLINMRFEESIVFTMPERTSIEKAKVVPLSLQLLLENAVKHNRVTPEAKLHLEIVEENGYLTVKNNLQPKKVVKKSSGVGLQNIKQRYALLTNRPVNIEKGSTQFAVRIPLLTKQVTAPVSVSKAYIDDKRYELAKKQVNELKGFYINFGLYLLAVPIFIVFNTMTSDFPWALFPIGGWGLGVLFHGAEVFNWNLFFGKEWESKKIKKLMDKESSHTKYNSATDFDNTVS